MWQLDEMWLHRFTDSHTGVFAKEANNMNELKKNSRLPGKSEIRDFIKAFNGLAWYGQPDQFGTSTITDDTLEEDIDSEDRYKIKWEVGLIPEKANDIGWDEGMITIDRLRDETLYTQNY